MKNAACSVFLQKKRPTLPQQHITDYSHYSTEDRKAAGIVVNDDGVSNSYKDTGLVNDVFTPERLDGLGQGNMAVGHVRYGTTGANARLNAQPILVNHYKGRMALAPITETL